MPRIEIPGGHADLYEKAELTPRRQIPVRAVLTRAQDLILKVTIARSVVSPSGAKTENPALPGPEVTLTQHDAELLEELNLAVAWAYLKGWSLDRALPATYQDFLDIPGEVAWAIQSEAARLNNGPAASEAFEPTDQTLADQESFTGGSGSTKAGSGATGTTPRSRKPRRKS